MPMSAKVTVKKNFSRYAHLYDDYAGIQHASASELIKKSPLGAPGHILDIGCGTGNYTLLLRDKFKDAEIKAIDISRDMVAIARRKCVNSGIDFSVADAERLELTDKFDLITSNATFQWFDDLKSSLSKYSSALAHGGSMLFSTFGPLTFRELSLSLKDALGKDSTIASDGFLGMDELSKMMKDNFAESVVEETILKKKYDSLEELLKHIKYTGTRGSGVGGISLWRRAMLERVKEAYMSNFGEITASYQIFYCRASI